MGIHGFLIKEREVERDFIDKNLQRIGMSRNSRTDAEVALQLIDEVEKLRDNRRSLSITYVELFIDYFELLDDHIPDWRVYCKPNIKKLLQRLEGDKQ